MSSEVNSTNNEPPKGLPPVAPPSGGFIAQLFLIPGLIVVVLVFIWWIGNYLVAEKRDADYFLANLKSDNPDIRWRAANDLAQVLKRPESIELASNPKFSLDLAEQLRIAVLDLEDNEKKALARMAQLSDPKARDHEWRKLQPQRDLIAYLISALGSFTIPTGAPVLTEIAAAEPVGDPGKPLYTFAAALGQRDPFSPVHLSHELKQLDDGSEGRLLKVAILRKRQAVFALANLGQNLQRFQTLAPEKQLEVKTALSAETAQPGSRGEWARVAYDYLTEGKSVGVDRGLAVCADSRDKFLRELVAVALNFWQGDLVEPTLEKLARDNGFGYQIEIQENE
jgi:hypothetical protein